MIDCVLSISETFQLRSRKKLSLVSLVAMERFCPSVIASSMSTLMFGMVSGWPKYYWTVTFRSLLKLMDATAAFGIHVSRLNVLYAESLAIVPHPVHSLVAAGAVTSPAIWPESAHRLGALLFLCRVPITRWTLKKILVPVPPILKFLVLTAVCSTVAAPTSRPTVAVITPVNVSTATMTTAASVPSASVKVSTTSAAESSNSDASTASVPRPKKPRTVVSGRIFRQRLANHYTSVELPSFDNVTGKEWDSRARAYVRPQVRIIFEDKRIGLTKRDFVSWTIEDLGALSIDICKVLSIKNYLTEFVFDIIKGYWTNDRIALGET